MTENKNRALALVALGVVFGDIGTSPLYAFKECLAHDSTPSSILGILSLILWSLILLISVKYAGIILRADNNGEGGILALLAQAFPVDCTPGRIAAMMTGFGLFGAALLYGDGVITPAISVLSATEGLEVISPAFSRFVIPLTVAILVGLFSIQKKGTGAIGSVFGKIMLVWFLLLGGLGLFQIIQKPHVLLAINPYYGVAYVAGNPKIAMLVLGCVFLSVTGGEALYADMGHFGRKPIQWAWHGLVLPSLMLNYLGQGAMVLSHPETASNPFYLLVPNCALIPMVLLATFATIIASQALISGAYSLTTQAVQLGYLPRLHIQHTNGEEFGQIYIPVLNTLLAIATIALVLTFKSSSALASAYGVAVTLTMLTTTILFFFTAKNLWHWNIYGVTTLCLGLGSIEFVFFLSNAIKFIQGGWVPVSIGVVLFYLMTTWKQGRRVILQRMQATMPLSEFVTSLSMAGVLNEKFKIHQVPGTAVFLSGSTTGTPSALTDNIKHNQVIHERNVVLSILTDRVPVQEESKKIEIIELGEGFWRIIAHHGFMENPSITDVIEALEKRGFCINAAKSTFFLGRERLIKVGKGLPRWKEGAFVFMSQNAQSPTDFYGLPSTRTIEISTVVEI
jgi:KUP system potassium uptake protein